MYKEFKKKQESLKVIDEKITKKIYEKERIENILLLVDEVQDSNIVDIKQFELKLEFLIKDFENLTSKKRDFEKEISENKKEAGEEIIKYLKDINNEANNYLKDTYERGKLGKLIKNLYEYIIEIQDLYQIISQDIEEERHEEQKNNTTQETKSIPNPFLKQKRFSDEYILDPKKQFSKYELYSRENSLSHFFQDHKEDIQLVISNSKNKEEAINYLKEKHGLLPGMRLSLTNFVQLCSHYGIK